MFADYVATVPHRDAYIKTTLSIGCVLFFAFFYAVSYTLSPFIVGLVVAYLLRPMVRRCCVFGIPHLAACSVLTAFIYLLFLGVVLMIAPLVKNIVSVQRIFAYQEIVWQSVHLWMQKFSFDIDLIGKVREYIFGGLVWMITSLIQTAGDLITNSLAVARIFMTVLLSPIIAFYFMKDWEKIRNGFFAILPLRFKTFFEELIYEVSAGLSLYLRGQFCVSLALASFYSIGLSLMGVHFGAVLGGAVGFFSFIPYVSLILGMLTSTIMLLFQSASWQEIISVFLFFLLGQTLDAFILTPVFIGKKTGLHPLIILFAVFAGAALKGFLGLLCALPVATIIIALLRVFKKHYLESVFYQKKRPHH